MGSTRGRGGPRACPVFWNLTCWSGAEEAGPPFDDKQGDIVGALPFRTDLLQNYCVDKFVAL